MKTPLLSFRSLLLALLVALSFTACKKGNDPAPAADVATRVAGQYTYSELSYGGKTLPADQTNLKGSISITRQTASTVSMNLNIRQKSTNDEFMVLSVDGMDVSESGNGDVSFRYEGEQVAVLKGNKLTINGEDDDNVRFSLSATK